jgi:hypothetical protein
MRHVSLLQGGRSMQSSVVVSCVHYEELEAVPEPRQEFGKGATMELV